MHESLFGGSQYKLLEEDGKFRILKVYGLGWPKYKSRKTKPSA